MGNNLNGQRILTYILLAINLILLLFKLSTRWEYNLGTIIGVITSITVLYFLYKWIFKKLNKKLSPINAALITYLAFYFFVG